MADKESLKNYSEFVIAANVLHENIVEHYYFMKRKVNRHDGLTFENHLIMNFMEGNNLAHYLIDPKFGPPKSLDKIRDIATQILNGIRYLHANQIIH